MRPPTFLLLPGWCDSPADFARLAPRLAPDRAIAVDWPDPATPDAGGMSERAAEAMRDAAGVVLVAQAHAGWVALDLARRFPERVVGLLSLSWILDDPPAPFVAALEAMAAAGTTRAAVDELTGMWLKGGEDPAVRDHVERVMRTHPDAAWARAAREILAAYRREGSPRRALARLPRPVSFAHVDSPSHFPAIDRTEEVAAAARALAAGLPRSAAR